MSNAVVTEASAELLKECDSGVKMAIKSLDDIAEYVSDERLSGIIADSRKKHQGFCTSSSLSSSPQLTTSTPPKSNESRCANKIDLENL